MGSGLSLVAAVLSVGVTLGASVALVAMAGRAQTRRARPGGRAGSGVAMLAALLGVWWGLFLVLGTHGFFRDRGFPHIVLGIVPPIILGWTLFSVSRAFRDALAAIPLPWVIGIQVYRALGVQFVILFAYHMLPGLFALPAGLGDMMIGIAAPLVALWYRARRPGAWGLAIAWNVVGLLDLVVAIGTGFLSAPGRFQVFPVEPTSGLMTLYPLVMVPTFAVPLSILLHMLSLRQLGQDRSVVDGAGLMQTGAGETLAQR